MANKGKREYKYEWDVFYQKCLTCWRRLTWDKFLKDKHAPFWIRNRCTECYKPFKRKWHHNWYENNKETYKQDCKLYHEKNKDRVNEKKRVMEEKFLQEFWFNSWKFHYHARYYVKIHKLKPNSCPLCWRDGPVEIHHPSYETFEKWSSVVFCCHYCHSAIHTWHLKCPEPIELLDLGKSLKG